MVTFAFIFTIIKRFFYDTCLIDCQLKPRHGEDCKNSLTCGSLQFGCIHKKALSNHLKCCKCNYGERLWATFEVVKSAICDFLATFILKSTPKSFMVYPIECSTPFSRLSELQIYFWYTPVLFHWEWFRQLYQYWVSTNC